MDLYKYKMSKTKCFSFEYMRAICFISIISFLIMDCYTVGINNFQNAETLGKKNFKIGASLGTSLNLVPCINTDSGYINFNDNSEWNDFSTLRIELAGQYGITKTTDIGLILGTGGASFYLKQNLIHTPKNFAFAFSVDGGIIAMPSIPTKVTSSSSNNNIQTEINWEQKDKYLGGYINLPLIISKRWRFFSLNSGVNYLFHHVKIETDYHETTIIKNEITMEDTTYNIDRSKEKSFDFHTLGLSGGFSFIFQHFEIFPTVSCLRVKDRKKDSFKWIFYPGMGFYVKF